MDAPFLFFAVTAWKEFKFGGFAAEGDSQNQCMNGVFSANKTDLITPSCLNLSLEDFAGSHQGNREIRC